MQHSHITVKRKKRIALVAHNHKKKELLAWAETNKTELFKHKLYSTGTTGKLLEEHLNIKVKKYQSGPLGGDLQIGAKIVERKIDILIFFWDPLESQPHDPDVKALLRAAVVWDIPMASNGATATYILTSNLIKEEYQHKAPYYNKKLTQI